MELVTLAATVPSPSATSVGKRISDPPPAMELTAPATRATPAAMARSMADTTCQPTESRRSARRRRKGADGGGGGGGGPGGGLPSMAAVRRWMPLVAICTGTFMLLVDITIINVALPDVAADLRTTFGELQWVVDAYALTLAALVLGAGSLADLYGRRRVYLLGLLLFALASLGCGLAPEPGVLVAARALQGIG